MADGDLSQDGENKVYIQGEKNMFNLLIMLKSVKNKFCSVTVKNLI